jgi:putative endonuclease
VPFTYVYMLQSTALPEAYYVGRTTDLKSRLKWHNAGSVPATRQLRPWAIRTAVAFCDSGRAHAFERYLKSGSGRAFAKKHF